MSKRLCALVFFCIPVLLMAQEVDTISNNIREADSLILKEDKKHSPKKAAIYSAVVPGLGQAYNRKYWKIPLVYIGLGVAAYSAYFNYDQYRLYRLAYQWRTDDKDWNDSLPLRDRFGDYILLKYDNKDIQDIKNYHRTNLDISVVAAILIYGLNIIDAVIDAHLYEFDVSDDLSLRFQPEFFADRYNRKLAGVKLGITF